MNGAALGAALERRLRAGRLGRPLHVYDELDSTMLRARALYREGAREGTTVVAESQSEGQGRRGRSFVSPRGGLYLTVQLDPLEDVAESWRVGFAAALAAREAILECGGPPSLFDWPNDLVSEGKKVGGILLDLQLPPDHPPALLLGLGLNVGPDPAAVDPALAGPAGAIRLDVDEPRAELAAALLARLEPLVPACGLARGWSGILEEVRACSLAGQGHRVTVQRPDGSLVTGQGLGLSEDGSLVLRDDEGNVVTVRYGERVES